MEPPPPARWSYAARAAYFGDSVCPFCDHRSPAGAKFCSECGSPLHLKPCNQCDAVNDRLAANCYKCGAECPALLSTPEATPVLPAADHTLAWPIPGDVGVSAIVTQPLLATAALRRGWPLAVVATILIAGAYAAYRINAATPDAMGVASQSSGAGERVAPTAASAVPMAVEFKPVEPETTAALKAPIPTTNSEAPKCASACQTLAPVPAAKRASARQTPATVPPTKRASAPQRPVPQLQAPAAQTLASASFGAADAGTRKARRSDAWEAMRVSLSRCSGDLIARIVCDQRVRRRFCEGHWGEAPECGSGIASDRG